MRRKLSGLGAITLLSIAILLLDGGFKISPEPIIPPASEYSQSSQKKDISTVVATDEKPLSEPYRVDAENRPDGFASIKKPAAPKADKYVTINNKLYPLRVYEPLAIPNDPQASQWWVTNARLDQMWDVPRGGNDTVLAIIDTGFALEHEEFTGRWHTNTGESGAASSEQPSALNCTDRSLVLSASCNLIDDDRDGTVDNETGAATYQNPSLLNCTARSRTLAKDCNRIDDDGNGFIDDTSGWDFINYDPSVQAGQLNPAGDGTTHGTLVAGVAAATGNNGKGLAGVDGGTKILPIQALDDNGYGDTLSVGKAILYAIEQGADVISLSLGSTSPDDFVQEAVQAAAAAGIVVVAASGNGGCECMVYPANYPEAVAVGALDTSSQRASFSAWGQNLDLMAPGTSINSASWQSSNQTSAYASGVNGTSFAAPMVAGMFTRLLSHQPQATPLQLIAALGENTNRLNLNPQIPRDNTLGYGALDAAKATSRMTTGKNSNFLYSFTPLSKGNFMNPAQPSEAIGGYLSYYCENGTIPATPIYEVQKTGSHFFTISPSEMSKALGTAYQAGIFGHACLQQPHDTAANVRGLDLFREFRNIYQRP